MTIFHRQDRALCLNDGCSALVKGQIYFVREVKTYIAADQALNLLGFGPDDWFNASRFSRVPDPGGGKSPATY